MLRFILPLALVYLALGQLGGQNWWQNIFGGVPGGVVDSIHGLNVQYDDQHDLIILVSATDCYLVDAASSGTEAQWDALIRNQDDLHAFTDTIYRAIQSGTGVTDITQQAATDFHSQLEQWECRNKHIHEVAYTVPSTA